jgi:hypothetical protein
LTTGGPKTSPLARQRVPWNLSIKLAKHYCNNMIITHKTFWPFVTATALLLAASAPAQTVYDWEQNGLNSPAPQPFTATLTVTGDEITQVSFNYLLAGGSPETFSVPQPQFQPVTVSDGTLEFYFGIGSTTYDATILDGLIIAPLHGTNAYDYGSFINPLYVPPPVTAPDSLSTWSLLISMAVGLILCHRRYGMKNAARGSF